MKFWEACKAMHEGKKIRCTLWPNKNQHLSLEDVDGAREAFQEWTVSAYWAEDMNSPWEIYEGPKLSFAEIVKGLKEGKVFKREKWPEDMYLYENEYKHVRIKPYGGEPWYLKIEDFEATDWQETEEDE